MLSNSTNSLDTSYKRLASGLRINSAKDDAAGLQISNRLTSQINGLTQGNRNAQDGISLSQTAEGAMDEMTTMYQRIRTLALQSANGTNSEADRASMQKEVSQLTAEIDRITSDTTFGGEKILNGTKGDTDGNVSFQVGADHDQTINVNLKTITTSTKDEDSGTTTYSTATLGEGGWTVKKILLQLLELLMVCLIMMLRMQKKEQLLVKLLKALKTEGRLSTFQQLKMLRRF